MAYKPEAPPDKRIFPEIAASYGGLSTPKNTGYSGYSGYKPAAVDLIIDETVIVELIDSTVLGVPIWFAIDAGWTPDPGDKTPVFYASELPALRQKTPEQLRDIFQVKRIFDGGMVNQ